MDPSAAEFVKGDKKDFFNPSTQKVQVAFALDLPFASAAGFNVRRAAFIQVIADVTDIAKENVKIESASIKTNRRSGRSAARSLLSTSLEVKTTVVAEDASKGDQLVGMLTLVNLNSNFASVNIPPATAFTQSPAVEYVDLVESTSENWAEDFQDTRQVLSGLNPAQIAEVEASLPAGSLGGDDLGSMDPLYGPVAGDYYGYGPVAGSYYGDYYGSGMGYDFYDPYYPDPYYDYWNDPYSYGSGSSSDPYYTDPYADDSGSSDSVSSGSGSGSARRVAGQVRRQAFDETGFEFGGNSASASTSASA